MIALIVGLKARRGNHSETKTTRSRFGSCTPTEVRPKKLTNAKAGVDSYKWSSDGRVIAFLARDGKTDDEQRSKNGGDDSIHIGHDYKYMRLWIIGLKERKSVLITRQTREVAGFDW